MAAAERSQPQPPRSRLLDGHFDHPLGMKIPTVMIRHPVKSGFFFGGVLTLTIALALQGRILNFECPPGTIDYCGWDFAFILATFGPVFLVSSIACSLALHGVKRARRD